MKTARAGKLKVVPPKKPVKQQAGARAEESTAPAKKSSPTPSSEKEWVPPLKIEVEEVSFSTDEDLFFFRLSVSAKPDVYIYVPVAEGDGLEVGENPVLDLTLGGYLTGSVWDRPVSDEHKESGRNGSPKKLSVEDQGKFLSAQYEVFRKKNPAGKIEEFEKRYVFDESFSPLVLLGREFYQRGNPRHQRLFDALNP
ncbi:MAG TPA: hypothetical protein DCY07_05310 [Rhodospirillaceae bacterium]|nr:hypothetical protein [Rhodospirillaceae bacterium]